MSFLRYLRPSQGEGENYQDLAHRFWPKVKKTEGCWLWIGARRKDGYGEIYYKGRTLSAHRVAYVLVYGPIPKGSVVCHKCDNTSCVRPDHLIAATQRENAQDAARKGRVIRNIGEENPMNVLSKRFSKRPLTKYKKKKIAQFSKEHPEMDLVDLAKHFRTSPRRVRSALKEYLHEFD